MSDLSPAVLDLDAARATRAAEAERLEGARPFLVHVVLTSFGVMPPDADPDAEPRMEVLDAADLVSDPGRLGEIARALVARVENASTVKSARP